MEDSRRRNARNGGLNVPPRAFSVENPACVRVRVSVENASARMLRAFFLPLQLLLAFPSLVFLGMLGVMLFRPPNLELYWLDRIAFGLVVLITMMRALLLRQDLRLPSAAWPMLALGTLVMAEIVLRPFDSTTWSVVAAKFVVPYALFYLAGLVFDNSGSLAWLEKFGLAVLAYLSFTAIMSLAKLPELVFPRFILDESIGIHADRARGPFLQACGEWRHAKSAGTDGVRRIRTPATARSMGSGFVGCAARRGCINADTRGVAGLHPLDNGHVRARFLAATAASAAWHGGLRKSSPDDWVRSR